MVIIPGVEGVTALRRPTDVVGREEVGGPRGSLEPGRGGVGEGQVVVGGEEKTKIEVVSPLWTEDPRRKGPVQPLSDCLLGSEGTLNLVDPTQR